MLPSSARARNDVAKCSQLQAQNHQVQIRSFHSGNSFDLSVCSATKGAFLFPCSSTWTTSSYLLALLVETELFL